MKIGRKDHENNENWQMAENEKKAVCKTARRAQSQKVKWLEIEIQLWKGSIILWLLST